MTAYQDRIPAPTTKPASTTSRAPAPKSKLDQLSGQQIKSAIVYNNSHWQGVHRDELLAMIRIEKGVSRFDETDIRAIVRIQLAERIPVDGKLSATTMTAFLRGGLHLTEVKAKPEEVRLLFYPGEFEDLVAWRKAQADAIADNGGRPLEHAYRAIKAPPGHGTIYVELRGKIVASIAARGGPPFSMTDYNNHTGDPSKAGTYKLGAGKAVTTPMWDDSEIAWGAPIRKVNGEIQFKNPGQDWKFATGPEAKLKQKFLPRDFEESYGTLMKEWRGNAFGKTAFQVEGSPGLFIHTGAKEETALKKEEEAHRVHERLELTHSHGCLHVDPHDRDEMMKTGYLQKGVTLVIKRYDESLDPTAKNRRRP